MSFDSLGLSAELCRAVSEKGYSEATPIQREAIPPILEGCDIMAGAQTGTGKTAGFTLPLLQRLNDSVPNGKKRPVRALILVPTRELAAQVHDSVIAYGKYLRLTSTVIFGGVSINPQIQQLRRGVDILVATPGRLLDHVSQNTLDLSSVEVLVLDEADRMLDMGFIRDIRKIMVLLPAQRQNLMFSATFSGEIKKLADSILVDPARVQVAKEVTADGIRQAVQFVEKSRKRELLSFLIGSNRWQQVLVFTRTKHGANRLAKQLEKDGIKSAAIHGDKSQGARTRALADFKAGKVRVLVATDIAARGLDIHELPHVVNYELPNVSEDYVHRIGRTGRAGCDGEALSLVDIEELKLLRDIEKLLGHGVDRRETEGFEPGEEFKHHLAATAIRKPGKNSKNRRRRNNQTDRSRASGTGAANQTGRDGSADSGRDVSRSSAKHRSFGRNSNRSSNAARSSGRRAGNAS